MHLVCLGLPILQKRLRWLDSGSILYGNTMRSALSAMQVRLRLSGESVFCL
jgi:hypothetical protein